MSLDTAHLAAFAAVVEEGGFDAAAYRLGVTPSAVSQRIKALESQLGQVVLRRARPVQPTAAGQIVLRLAKQVALVEGEALAQLAAGQNTGRSTSVPVAVNADSLATWFLPALAAVPTHLQVNVELHAEDQDHSAALLRDGTVMAAVTADDRPVQGCRAVALGAMGYVAVGSPAFCAKYLPNGATQAALNHAPMLVFNRKDALQERFARMVTGATVDPPVTYLPSSTAFIDAAKLGLGWGMVPNMMATEHLAEGSLVEIAPGRTLDVPLYWQRWRLDSGILDMLSRAVRGTAAASLTQSAR